MLNIKDKKILFIGAHLDDIEIGAGAFLINSLKKTDNVYAYVFSLGRKDEKEKEENHRLNIYKHNMKFIGVNPAKIYPTSNIFMKKVDTEFYKSEVQEKLRYHINEILRIVEPDIIVFNSPDHHNDHKILNSIVKEFARPINSKSLILMEYEIPSSSYDQKNIWNYYHSYNLSVSVKKTEMLLNYEKYKFLRKDGDLRSIKYMETSFELNGKLTSSQYAERFRLTIYE